MPLAREMSVTLTYINLDQLCKRMATPSVTRIAFIAMGLHEYSRQLASGVSRFALPADGYIARDFLLNFDAKEMPATVEAWSPDAVVSFVSAEQIGLLDPLAERGIPVVNTARAEPTPKRAVVLGDAEEAYREVLRHFHALPVAAIWQFTMGEQPSQHSSSERYRQFAQSQGIPANTFSIPDPEHLDFIGDMQEVDPAVGEWLCGLPQPAGIFSQSTLAGLYLARTCELLRLEVPAQIAIIGADGFDVANASNPPVTSIRAPAEKVGYEAARLAITMLDGAPAPRDFVSVPGVQLILRESTCSPLTSGCDIDAALEFIDRHACEGVKVNDVLAHTQGVSRVTFHKRFLARTGITPASVIQLRKLHEARRLLAETEISPGAIAGICGYQDYTHFYRVFRKQEGVSPSNFRRIAT